jgi:hypothetical protein
LLVKVNNDKGVPLKSSDVTIRDRFNALVLKAKTDESGTIVAELPEYAVDGKNRKDSSPYTVEAAGQRKEIILDRNKEILIP